MKLKVQLVFNGNCEEAFNVYKQVLKGEISFLFRKKEDTSLQAADNEKEKISHMVLNTKHFELGGEDAPCGTIVKSGSNTKLVLVFYELSETYRVFAELSRAGIVVTPLQKVFFSDAYGELVDKFGIRWLIMMTDENYSNNN